jgi:hypothetical protein
MQRICWLNEVLTVTSSFRWFFKLPDWTEERGSDEWHAFKRVGNKVLRVVVAGKQPPFRVVTMFYDRRVKP